MADAREQPAPPAGEQVHMPEPSLLPILNAGALALAIVGVTLSPVLIVAGLVVFIATTISWARGARREFDELPGEHHE
jgi:hypothetical protein